MRHVTSPAFRPAPGHRLRGRTIAALACGLGLLAAGDHGRAEEKGTPAAARCWSSERTALDGPTLNPAWFSGRRAVVYLVPAGRRGDVRHVAAEVMRASWSSGDWSLSHVFVCGVPGRLKLAAGRRSSIHDMAVRLAEESGQAEEFIPANEERLRETVLFVHDPEGTVWPELLGKAEATAPAVVLLDAGKIVRVFELARRPDPPADGEPEEAGKEEQQKATELAAEVRRLLPEAREDDDG